MTHLAKIAKEIVQLYHHQMNLLVLSSGSAVTRRA